MAKSVPLAYQPCPQQPPCGWPFLCGFKVTSPIASVCDGDRVTLLAPEPSYYAKHLLHRVCDVTTLVKRRENVLGLTVGDGWYGSFDGCYALGPPPRRVLAQLGFTTAAVS